MEGGSKLTLTEVPITTHYNMDGSTYELGGYIDFHYGTVHLGHAYKEVDGSYVFVFARGGGCWSDYQLRWIADELTALNEPYEDFLREEFPPG